MDGRFLLVFVAIFAAGFLAGWNKKPNSESVRVDAQPGVECEVKLAKGREPKTIVCRLDDGKHNAETTP